MTSSQPVTTPNAINFTPDNKQCYAYSGVVAVDNTLTNVLEFNTNSEYLIVGIQFFKDSVTSENYEYKVIMNDVIIVHGEWTSPLEDNPNIPFPIELIIPPFTKCAVTLQNLSDTASRNWSTTLIGKVIGMTETEYQ